MLTATVPGAHPLPVEDARTEAIEDALAAFNDDSADGFAAIFTDDALLYGDPQIAGQSVYAGPAGARAWVQETRERWHVTSMVLRGQRSVADSCLLDIDFIVETQSGGSAWRLAVVVRFSGSKIAEMRTYADRATALATLAGHESPPS